MRSEGLWKKEATTTASGASGNGKNDITRDVVGIARSIQENTQPPLDIAAGFTRRFTFGESYDPFDFSNTKLSMERKTFRKSKNTVSDPFERTGIDPRNLYAMPEILSRFITSTGQILPRSVTGCNGKNQKRLSDAIKTARACGLLSSTHKHARYLPSRNL
ncbi:ribosomal protein S18 [Suhomyces tanzawaensis NRRL Y-17324]|uniref:Small ribosomal subunit protein bS18m n=1 Tax=Suhomyces tanzawaensis NRRL Y-17324 TaxID=984487 RepID=A0A1E4SN19_9ASCO|nr:ribosomal protein S18 [Suhomyces tanzawaensis NRRL Y-17324]ODV80886.1 ribosomal protein S18 [Suhomyces tanzawaensis NRRL Y-17324]